MRIHVEFLGKVERQFMQQVQPETNLSGVDDEPIAKGALQPLLPGVKREEDQTGRSDVAKGEHDPTLLGSLQYKSERQSGENENQCGIDTSGWNNIGRPALNGDQCSC